MFVAWYQSPRQRGVFCDNWSYFLSKPYVVAPHLGCLLWDGSEGGGSQHVVFMQEIKENKNRNFS